MTIFNFFRLFTISSIIKKSKNLFSKNSEPQIYNSECPSPPPSPLEGEKGRVRGGSMGFCPIFSGMDRDLERNGDLHHCLHFSLDHRERLFDLFFGDLKDQFVVDLHDHLR